MSHSKRNTSRAVFTSHERAMAKSHWGSNSARLNRDSFLPFGSCGLCLEIARDPVSCLHGDVFCRECALANLLAQKKEIKRTERARQNEEHEAARAKATEDAAVQERAVRDFELTQAGLSAGAKSASNGAEEGRRRRRGEEDDAVKSPDGNMGDQQLVPAGTKRKFALNDDELSRIQRDDHIKAKKAIEDEKAAKQKLPSFWTPSLTPGVEDSNLPPVKKTAKSSPVCPASSDDNLHHISMQKLVTLGFKEEEEVTAGKGKRRICPSCLKGLTNSSNPVMAQSCGHVLCLSCVKKFLVPSSTQPKSEQDIPIMCYVCDAPVSSGAAKNGASGTLPRGLIMLRSEGTGFSARGTSTVEKSGVAFQC